jgi:hypothetical protein
MIYDLGVDALLMRYFVQLIMMMMLYIHWYLGWTNLLRVEALVENGELH